MIGILNWLTNKIVKLLDWLADFSVRALVLIGALGVEVGALVFILVLNQYLRFSRLAFTTLLCSVLIFLACVLYLLWRRWEASTPQPTQAQDQYVSPIEWWKEQHGHRNGQWYVCKITPIPFGWLQHRINLLSLWLGIEIVSFAYCYKIPSLTKTSLPRKWIRLVERIGWRVAQNPLTTSHYDCRGSRRMAFFEPEWGVMSKKQKIAHILFNGT